MVCRARGNAYLRSLVLAALLLLAVMAPSAAQPATVYFFNIPAESLAQALNAFSEAASQQIVFSEDIVGDRTAPPLHGSYTRDQALSVLLQGTDLEAEISRSGVMMIRRKEVHASRREDTAAPPAPVYPRAMETVVVTVNKRPEDVQTVPQSVYVATDQILERTSTRDFDDLTEIVPALSITKTSQPANNSINIRGVGTYAFSIAVEASTAVVIDDIPLAFQAQAFRALNDVAQLEVLRGPQSTLFGKSASAGVINITTKAPTPVFTAGLNAMTTGDHETRVELTLSGPMSDTLGFRLSVGADDYRGNLFNVYNDTWVNGHNDVDARAKLVWQPSDDWTVSLSGSWDNTRGTCCTYAYQYVSQVTPQLTFGNFGGGAKATYSSPSLTGITSVFSIPSSTAPGGLITIVPGPNNRRIAEDVNPKGNAVDLGMGFKIERRLAGFTLTSITGYDRYDLHDNQDTDFSAVNWGPGGLDEPGVTVVGGSANGGSFAIDSVTEELRVTSPSSDTFHFVAGFFFSRTGGNRFFIRGSNALTQEGALTTVPPTTSPYSSYGSFAHQTNYALFGQGTYDLTGALRLIAGLRVNLEEINFSFKDNFNDVTYGRPSCSTATPSGLAISTCDTTRSITGRAGVQYQITPRIMAFASYDRGFKGAAYDLSSSLTNRSLLTMGIYAGKPTADAILASQPVKPETVNAFQIGVKSVLFDRMTLNVTAYDEIFKGFQAQSKDDLTQISKLNSIGRVTTKGVEVELAAYLGSNVSVNAAATYDDATINNFPNAACYIKQTAALGCFNAVQDLSHTTLPDTPRWQLSWNGEYNQPLGGGYDGVLTASYHYQSSAHHSLVMDPGSFQPGYSLVNAGLGVKHASWKLTVFCNNVFGQNYSSARARDASFNINPYGPATAANPRSDAIRWQPGRDSQRFFGVRLSISR